MRHLALTLASLMVMAPVAGAKTAKRRATKSAPAPAPTLWVPPAATPGPAAATPAAADSDAGASAAAGAGAATLAAPPTPEPEAPKVAPLRPKMRAASLAANEGPAGEAKDAPPAVAGASPDLERLRADYDRLRDELFRARSRAQIVEEGLWSSRLSATFRWKGGPSYLVHHASVRLDGADVWDSGDKPVTDDLVTVAERPVKPGPHALTLRIDIRPGKKSKDSDKLGYVSEHTFAIIVPDGKRTRVDIKGDEDGDAPEYEPEIEVELETLK
jgi:hypothetical protein